MTRAATEWLSTMKMTRKIDQSISEKLARGCERLAALRDSNRQFDAAQYLRPGLNLFRPIGLRCPYCNSLVPTACRNCSSAVMYVASAWRKLSSVER